ncbi:glycine betaine ABC transporter substrate-binding protein [Haloglycomyces albus]|uniref:glycine betaine ABC transporter substrate-binding protein n=1 Tax=Haloglycomyces albus TaxID=526067 RepID=UPI00146FC80F|nr:glycine betaine ABC transporter substrate-binding protein [Haloglycomyces albus]
MHPSDSHRHYSLDIDPGQSPEPSPYTGPPPPVPQQHRRRRWKAAAVVLSLLLAFTFGSLATYLYLDGELHEDTAVPGVDAEAETDDFPDDHRLPGPQGTDTTIRVIADPPESYFDGLMADYWTSALKRSGWNVELVEIDALESDAIDSAFRKGTADVHLSAFFPSRIQSSIEDVRYDDYGAWNENVGLHIALPDEMEGRVESLRDLQGKAEEFGGTLLVPRFWEAEGKRFIEDVFPYYGIEGFDMEVMEEAEVDPEFRSMREDGETPLALVFIPMMSTMTSHSIVVPDPDDRGSYGSNMRILTRDGFKLDHPELAEAFASFNMDTIHLLEMQSTAAVYTDLSVDSRNFSEWIMDNPIGDFLDDEPREITSGGIGDTEENDE